MTFENMVFNKSSSNVYGILYMVYCIWYIEIKSTAATFLQGIARIDLFLTYWKA